MERIAGIDLASEEHRLVVVDGDGRQLEQQRIRHSEAGLRALVGRLLELQVARVAIERPNGLVVDRLLEAGIAIVPVHPNQLAAARDRYRSGGGKSDGFDAYVLAELARTDMHRYRVLEPDSDETRALRALTRARDDLVGHRVALANQLRAQLDSFWGRRPDLRRSRLAHRARVSRALPQPRGRPWTGREAARRLPRPQRLLRPPGRRRAAAAAARGAHRQDRRARKRGSPPDRARPRRRAQADRRADQAADQPDPLRARHPPRRADLPLALPRPQVGRHRRRAGRRDRRPPRTLRHPRPTRGPRRPKPGRDRVR